MGKIATLSLCVLAAALTLHGQDRKDKETPATMAYAGRIEKVNTDKRTITIRDARRGDSLGVKDKAGGVRAGDMIEFGLADRATITFDGRPATLAEIRPAGWVRVHTSAGTGAAGSTGATGTGGTRDTAGSTGGRDKVTPTKGEGGTRDTVGSPLRERPKDLAGTTGGMMKAERIEAFTREPIREKDKR